MDTLPAPLNFSQKNWGKGWDLPPTVCRWFQTHWAHARSRAKPGARNHYFLRHIKYGFCMVCNASDSGLSITK